MKNGPVQRGLKAKPAKAMWTAQVSLEKGQEEIYEKEGKREPETTIAREENVSLGEGLETQHSGLKKKGIAP